MENSTFAPWVLALTTCGLLLQGCGQPRVFKEYEAISHAAGVMAARSVNEAVSEGGEVLFVHRQASIEIADAWRLGLSEGLDARFTLAEYGLNELSEKAATSVSPVPPLKEALAAHPDAVAMVNTIAFDPEISASFIKQAPPMVALAWPVLRGTEPLFKADIMKAGIFENPRPDPSVKYSPRMSPEELCALQFIVVTPENLDESLAAFP